MPSKCLRTVRAARTKDLSIGDVVIVQEPEALVPASLAKHRADAGADENDQDGECEGIVENDVPPCHGGFRRRQKEIHAGATYACGPSQAILVRHDPSFGSGARASRSAVC